MRRAGSPMLVRPVRYVAPSNAHGGAVTLIGDGAARPSLMINDRNGPRTDVALGNGTLADYLDTPPCLAAAAGRYPNRPTVGRSTLRGGGCQARGTSRTVFTYRLSTGQSGEVRS